MKHFYLSLFSLCAVLGAYAQEAKTVPYFSTLYGDTDWAVIDNNYDGSTWTDESGAGWFEGSTTVKGKIYTYNSNNQANDWLFSPAVSLEGGKTYKVTFYLNRGNGYSESVAFYVSGDKKTNAILSTTPLKSWTGIGSKNEEKKRSLTFTPETTGDYYFSFYCNSAADLNRVAVSDFSIALDVLTPAAPANFTCTPASDESVEATLSWTLPTVDADGGALPADAAFSAINISRDGTPVATLAGTETTWTDTEATGLTAGKHTYEITVTLAGAGTSPAAKCDSPLIGPAPSFSLPYDAGISSLSQSDFEENWTQFKGAGSKNSRTFNFVDSYSGNHISFYDSSYGRADEWLVSPVLNFSETGTYKVTVDYAFSSYYDFSLELAVGKGTDASAYTVAGATAEKGDNKTFSASFSIDAACKKNVAVHVGAEEWSGTFRLYSLKVEKINVCPAQVADLKATVQGGEKVLLSWTYPALDNTGAALASITKAEIYRDDELIHTIAEGITPGAAGAYTDTPATNGAFTYKVITYLGEIPAEGDAITATSAWVGDETRALPYSINFTQDDPTKAMWLAENANNDKYGWTIGNYATLNLSSDDYTDADDYLMSPYLDLTAGTYRITYAIRGGSSTEFGIGTVTDKAAAAASYTQLATVSGGSSYSFSEKSAILTVTSATKAAVALHAAGRISYNSNRCIEISSFKIEAVAVYPDAPEGLAITPAADGELAATLTWTNPTTSSEYGIEPVIVKAVITRKAYGTADEPETVGELTEGLTAGAPAQWTDTTVPAAGLYEYGVLLHGPAGAGTDDSYTHYTATAVSPRIGGAYEAPFSTENGFVAPEWTIVKGSARSTWKFNSGATRASLVSYDKTPDDWLISPAIKLENRSIYECTVLATMDVLDDVQTDVKWDFHLADAASAEAAGSVLATVSTTEKSTPQTHTFTITVRAPKTAAPASDGITTPNVLPGDKHIAIHANTNGALDIHGVSIRKVGNTTGITDIEADIDSATALTVYDLTGAEVARTDAPASLASLGLRPGIYLVAATMPDGSVKTLKLALR